MQPPTTLSRQAIDELKRIYQSEFGEALTDDIAEEMALRFVRVFHLWSRSFAQQAKSQLTIIEF